MKTRELVLATFIQIMQVGLKTHDTQGSAAVFLLEALNRTGDVRFDGYREDLSDKKISWIVNRQCPVPDGIRQASLVDELADVARDYYRGIVLSDLNPFRRDDVLEELVRVIKSDKEIGDRKREQLLKLYDDGDDGGFLGEVFLYVVNRANQPKGDFIGYDDAPLLSEVNYECPQCRNRLVKMVKGNAIKHYMITHIYPAKLKGVKAAEFKAAFPKPKDMEGADNLIALCDACAESYLVDPTVEEYQHLHELKAEITKIRKAKDAVDVVKLEDDIRIVLDALSGINESNQLTELEYEALHIDEKFDSNNFILMNETQVLVVQYYRYIEAVFSEADTDFDMIASEVKLCSQKLEKSGLSQSDIIEYLAEWIRSQARLGTDSKLACRAVVAFFIQNCEVFYKR